MNLQSAWALTIVVSTAAAVQAAPPGDSAEQLAASLSAYEKSVSPFLRVHCSECHGDVHAEKELNLAKLEPDMKTSTSAARWAVVLQQLRSGDMPPKEKPRPDAKQLEEVTAWIESEMKRAGKHLARREAYDNGNSIDHGLLFGSEPSARFDVPSGVRRLSADQYAALMAELAKGMSSVSQPFSPQGKTTFKDMGAPRIDEPTTAQLLRNALLIVEQRYTAFKVEDGKLKAAQQSTPKQFLRLLDEADPATEAEVQVAIKQMFDLALRRLPGDDELNRFTALYDRNVKDAGRVTGTRYTLAAVFMLPEAVFRFEHGVETPDPQGRVRLTPREIAFAISNGLTDRRPESWLLTLAEKGELDTDAGVALAVKRFFEDPKLQKPRILRFFREYFQYAAAEEVFKDNKEYPDHDPRVLVEDTDRLVQYILDEDKDVLHQLLTTNKAFVAYKTGAETKKKREEELAKFEMEKRKDPQKFATKKPPKNGRSIYEAYNLSDFPDEQPVELPGDERAGILTQPSWLVAFSKSDENHAILRGKWVRERLLGGVVPDIPITVDAQLPLAPEQTLRERMAVTQQEYCWQCHRLMNRVGYPFEAYDHIGRFRSEEQVLDLEATAMNVDKKGKPLGPVMKGVHADATGGVEFVSDEQLEGSVEGAVKLMHRLARSPYVEQVFVRHAFRYWLGRNETLGDAASLQAAHRAYRESGGSMQALITALLTSESFLYRVPAGRISVDDSTADQK